MAEKIEWVEIIEPKSREKMFANLITGQVVWEEPKGVKIFRQSEQASQWWELFDHKTGKFYYYNAKTQQTVWQRPSSSASSASSSKSRGQSSSGGSANDIQQTIVIPLAKLQILKQNTESLSRNAGTSSTTTASSSSSNGHGYAHTSSLLSKGSSNKAAGQQQRYYPYLSSSSGSTVRDALLVDTAGRRPASPGQGSLLSASASSSQIHRTPSRDACTQTQPQVTRSNSLSLSRIAGTRPGAQNLSTPKSPPLVSSSTQTTPPPLSRRSSLSSTRGSRGGSITCPHHRHLARDFYLHSQLQGGSRSNKTSLRDYLLSEARYAAGLPHTLDTSDDDDEDEDDDDYEDDDLSEDEDVFSDEEEEDEEIEGDFEDEDTDHSYGSEDYDEDDPNRRDRLSAEQDDFDADDEHDEDDQHLGLSPARINNDPVTTSEEEVPIQVPNRRNQMPGPKQSSMTPAQQQEHLASLIAAARARETPDSANDVYDEVTSDQSIDVDEDNPPHLQIRHRYPHHHHHEHANQSTRHPQHSQVKQFGGPPPLDHGPPGYQEYDAPTTSTDLGDSGVASVHTASQSRSRAINNYTDQLQHHSASSSATSKISTLPDMQDQGTHTRQGSNSSAALERDAIGRQAIRGPPASSTTAPTYPHHHTRDMRIDAPIPFKPQKQAQTPYYPETSKSSNKEYKDKESRYYHSERADYETRSFIFVPPPSVTPTSQISDSTMGTSKSQRSYDQKPAVPPHQHHQAQRTQIKSPPSNYVPPPHARSAKLRDLSDLTGRGFNADAPLPPHQKSTKSKSSGSSAKADAPRDSKKTSRDSKKPPRDKNKKKQAPTATASSSVKTDGNLEKFARENITRHLKSGNILNQVLKRKTSVKAMITWTKSKMKQPMIATLINSEAAADACTCFKLIQMFMGDREISPNQLSGSRSGGSSQRGGGDTLNQSGGSASDMDMHGLGRGSWTSNTVALELIIKGCSKPALRDEILVQLCRQTTANPNPESLERGLELLATCLTYFGPSAKFAPFLSSFVANHSHVTARTVCANKLYKRIAASGYGFAAMTNAGSGHGGPNSGGATGSGTGSTYCRRPTCVEEVERVRYSLKCFTCGVFGESIISIMDKQMRVPSLLNQSVPWILTTLFDAIISFGGEKTEGIFRCAGDLDEIMAIKLLLETFDIEDYFMSKSQRPGHGYQRHGSSSYNPVVTLEEILSSRTNYITNSESSICDVHSIACLLKLWFREMPEPIIPRDMYSRALDHAQDASRVCELVGLENESFPMINRLVLAHLIHFLQRFSRNSNTVSLTRMDDANLALVWAPNLLRAPPSPNGSSLMAGNSRGPNMSNNGPGSDGQGMAASFTNFAANEIFENTRREMVFVRSLIQTWKTEPFITSHHH